MTINKLCGIMITLLLAAAMLTSCGSTASNSASEETADSAVPEATETDV
jgi:outer membrane biogenesis lipoprotein LolB